MPESREDIFCPSSRTEWRVWLDENHATRKSIWLVFFKASSSSFNLSWSEAVDEALCFGWIDSTKKTVDDERFKQYFAPRKAKSTWSKINKEKVAHLTESGLMTAAGQATIELAKQNGNWSILDDVERLIIPPDLEKKFNAHPNAKAFFLSLSKSIQKGMLGWIVLAKRPETREKRIKEIAEHASKGLRPTQFR